MLTVALLLLIGVSGALGRVYTASEINWPTDAESTYEHRELLLLLLFVLFYFKEIFNFVVYYFFYF